MVRVALASVISICFATAESGCVASGRLPRLSATHTVEELIDQGQEPSQTSLQRDFESAYAPSVEMKRFVRENVPTDALPKQRLDALIGALETNELLNLRYQNDQTHSASETFANREGNCLSFTMMVASLAELADLEVSFQRVAVPTRWYLSDGWIALDEHINLLVRAQPNLLASGSQLVIDFNTPDFFGRYPTRTLTKAAVGALYFSNLGAESLRKGDFRRARQRLSYALRLDPSSVSALVNLAALELRNSNFDKAESALILALQEDSTHPVALASLADTYAHLGQHSLGRKIEARITKLRAKDPLNLLRESQELLDAGQTQLALKKINVALKSTPSEPLLFMQRARIAVALENALQAEEDLQLAEEHSVGAIAIQQVQDLRKALLK